MMKCFLLFSENELRFSLFEFISLNCFIDFYYLMVPLNTYLSHNQSSSLLKNMGNCALFDSI